MKKQKKALRKDFYMEIRKSRGRFMSILLIVALGVAFLSGIRAAEPDMRYSGDAYFDRMNLMDIKVLGTMGLTDQDVEKIRELDLVEWAEGSYSSDALCQVGDSQKVLHVMSLIPDMNEYSVSKGRLPEKADECLIDEDFLVGNDLKVGDQIRLASGKEEPVTDTMKGDTYTIVGAGSSCQYISFGRGSSLIGTGEVKGFMVVVPQAYDMEVYTEICVTVKGAKAETAFTDAYDQKVEDALDEIEKIADKRCQVRYEEITGEAKEKLSDARKELEDGKKEADEKLSDAEKELKDGEKKLTDGEKQLSDGQAALDSGRKTLDEKQDQLLAAEKSYQSGLSEYQAGKAELDSQAAEFSRQLPDALAQIESGEKTLKEELQKAKGQLDEKAKELEENKQKIEELEAQLPQLKEQLQQAQKAQEDAEKEGTLGQLKEQQTKLKEQETSLLGQLDEAKARQEELEGKLSLVKDSLQKIETGLSGLQGQKQQLEQDLALLSEQIENLKQVIAGKEEALEDTSEEQAQLSALLKKKAECEAGIKALEQQIVTLEAQKKELETNEAALVQGIEEIQKGTALLEEGLKQVQEGISMVEEGITSLEALPEQIQKLQDGISQMEEAIARKPELEAGEEALKEGYEKLEQKGKEGEAKLVAAREQLTQARQLISASYAKLSQAKDSLDSAYVQIKDGQVQIAEGYQTLKDNEEALAKARKEIEENRQKLLDGKKEYEEKKLEARQKIEDGEKEIADAEEEIADLKKPKWYVYDRSILPEYSGYGDNADRMRAIGEVFPVLFFLVAALISLTTMTRMVEEQRIQIGTLKALGYGKFSIIGKYMYYALMATIGGSAVGILFGEKVFPFIIVYAYKIMYKHLPDIVIPYNLAYAALGTAAAVLCTTAATLFSCYRELAAQPAVLMRPPSPKQGKRILMERIPFIWKRLSFIWKSTFRNLIRYKKRFFMTVIGIGGCMALMLVGFGLKDSIFDIARIQYKELQTYNGAVYLKENPSQKGKEELIDYLEGNRDISGAAEIYMKMVDVKNGKNSKEPYLCVAKDKKQMEQFVHFRNRKDHRKTYSLDEEGVILTEKLAKMLDVETGDTFVIENTEEGDREVKVSAICENYLGHYIYMSEALYEKLYQQAPDYNGFFFGLKEYDQEKLYQTGEKILGYSEVQNVTYTDNMEDRLNDMLKSLNLVIVVLIVSAGALAFIVLYNLNNINITERKRELATIKVLGFFDMEVAAYVYRENILLTFIGAAAGCLMGWMLHKYVIVTVEIEEVMFGRNINFPSYIYSLIFTVLFSLIVNLVMYFKLKKIDMVESLKSVE